MTMTPSVGRIVHVIVDPKVNNGSDVAPAVVTRVWSDENVNVRVLHDGPDVGWRTSVSLFESRVALEEHHDKLVAEHPQSAFGAPNGAFWPPKV